MGYFYNIKVVWHRFRKTTGYYFIIILFSSRVKWNVHHVTGVYLFSFTICLFVCDFYYAINIVQMARPYSTKIWLNKPFGRCFSGKRFKS